MGNSQATHIVRVKTGEKKGASLDANVYVRLGDAFGNWSEQTRIDTTLKNDFKNSNVDIFHLNLPDMLHRITELEIIRDSTGVFDEWYVEKVTVQKVESGDTSYFPVNRWIHANDRLKLSQYDYSLPSEDKYPEQRAAELEEKRSLYQLVAKELGVFKQVATPPRDELFNTDYQIFIGSTLVQLGIQTKVAEFFTGDFKSLEDFQKVYSLVKLPVPEGALRWKEDEDFGNQRLIGVNPAVIKLCQKIPERFAVTAEMVEPMLEGKTLDEAMKQKKIYIEDLSFLENLKCTGDNKLCSPYGLFYVRNSGDFVPIAIQIEAEPAHDNPVFLPTDPEYTWLLAKMWLNLADASVHQSASHLGFTHLLMESVVVCANRQLSPSHPIFRLLAPHFLYLISINSVALTQLIAEGAWVDQVMQIGRDGMLNIIRRKLKGWNLKEDGNLLKNLQNRGVDDETALPNYHYRDDAKLVWNAITEYVSDIVDQVYDSEEKLLADEELQNFASELSSPEGAGMQGVPSKFDNTEELKEILTVFIFTSSVQHAAVNFGQYDEYGFAPNYPARIRTERPKTKDALTERDVVNALPTKEEMLKVVLVTRLLSSKATDSLGYFEMEYTSDPRSQKALHSFRDNLKKAGDTIDMRNDVRANKYTFLHPREIPNAISI